jgi:hypothetical protein
MSKFSHLSIAAVVVLAGSHALRAQPGIIVAPGESRTALSGERQVGSDKSGIQTWFLNDLDAQREVMTGTILGLAKNDHNWYDDKDYNICIKPDFPYRYLTTNRWGYNTPQRQACGVEVPSGVLEAEIRSASYWPWVTQHFAKNASVIAYGWWVYDAGHPEENKPAELHPLIWMATAGRVADAYLWAVQDISAMDWAVEIGPRFLSMSNMPVDESVDIKYLPSSRTTVSRGTAISRVNVVREIGRSLLAGAQPFGDRVRINIFLPPSFIGLLQRGGNLEPLSYRSEFGHSVQSLLHEDFQFHTETDPATNQKVGFATIALGLDSPAEGPLSFVLWDWGTNGSAQPTTTPQPVAPFTQNWKLKYTPRDGFIQNEWSLDMSGATVSQSQLQTIYRDASSTEAPGYDRTFVGSIRKYHLEPSHISLSTDRVKILPNQTCPPSQLIQVETNNLLPGTTLPSSQFAVKLISEADGNAVNDSWHTLSFPSLSYTSPSNTLKATQVDATKLNIEFTQTPGQTNRAWASVAVVTATDIGEGLDDLIDVNAACQIFIETPDLRSLMTFHRPETDGLVSRVLRQRGYALDLEQIDRTARAADKPWIDAYLKWERGAALSTNERIRLISVLQEGSRLPVVSEPVQPSPTFVRTLTSSSALSNARSQGALSSGPRPPTAGQSCPNLLASLIITAPAGGSLECVAQKSGLSVWTKH